MMELRKSGILWTISLLITIFFLSYPAYAKYSGGTGEPNNPYQIATAEDLMLLGESPDDYDKHFIMIDDIDLDPNLPGRKVFNKAVIAPDVNDVNWWRFDGTSFNGVFDGNGYIISQLTIKGKGYLGLFGRLESSGDVKNLGMLDLNINGSGECVGGLVGDNGGRITISYCTGMVTGERIFGGIVGCNHGYVTHCYSTSRVIGTGSYYNNMVNVGGICSFGRAEETESLGSV